MLASQIVCQLAPMGAKKFKAGIRRAEKRKALAATFIPLPVTIDQPRLSDAGEVVEVETVGLRATVRGDVHAPELLGARTALAHHLRSEAGYGPQVRRVVLVGFVGQLELQELVLEGQLSAVERTVPDTMTRQHWAAVGVEGLEAAGMPIVKQMENRPL
jgi:hypothetical protein